MSDNVTEIKPPQASVAADQEPERKVRTFRVLKRMGIDEMGDVWNELEPHTTPWSPSADEVGEQFGEGDFLLIERESDYSFHHVYPMRVVAEKVYRLADDDPA
jgi:hypothetical protein